MSNWVIKIIPKSIRKMIFSAIDLEIREYFSVNAIQGYAVNGANVAILAVKDKIDEETAAKWCVGCEKGSKALSTIARAVNPNGDGGMSITEQEGDEIVSDLKEACGSLITQEWIDGIIMKAEESVKKYLSID